MHKPLGIIAGALIFFSIIYAIGSFLPEDVLSDSEYFIEPEVRVIFGGDMMFDRTVRREIDAKGGDFIFSCIDPVLQTVDFVVANLEGPITGNESVSINSLPGDEFNYTFTFDPSVAAMLYRHNILVVNLGNNHIYNFGSSGISSTTQALDNARVGYFGAPPSYGVAKGRYGIIGRRVPLTFINYNEFGGNASTTRAQIRIARVAGELPIVYTHWGVEYATTSSPYMQDLAHGFIDAGAEIIIGSHPHVVEESEVYRGKYIYYSLGNFIFDQYWMDSVRNGLLVEVVFNASGVRAVREIPIELGRDRRTCPIE